MVNTYVKSNPTKYPPSIASLILGGMLLTTTAGAYEVADVSNGGNVRGVIRLDGSLPKEDLTIISKDNHVCGDGNTIMNPVTVDANNGLANAVISILDVASGKDWSSDSLEIVQEKCKFLPFVQIGQKSEELTIHNKDPLLHNIHAYEIIGRARRTLFNVAQPSAGQIDKMPLKLRRGDVVQIACDAHNWMNAWVYTADNPYVSVSGTDGAFSIENIPAGTYEVKVWHPTLGETTTQVVVQQGGNTELDVALNGG